MTIRSLRGAQHPPLERRVFPLAQSRSGTRPAPYVWADTSTPSLRAPQSAHGTVPTKPVPRGSTGTSASARGEASSALNGNAGMAARAKAQTMASTYVQGARQQLTEHSRALEQRRHEPCTPYHLDAWFQFLHIGGLLPRYSQVLDGLRFGFIVDFPPVQRTQAPANKSSISTFRRHFDEIISAEIRKGRYIGPMSDTQVTQLIGPFQSSPFSITEKPAKPGKYRIIQNFSFPISPSSLYPNASINSFVISDKFPCTYGTFTVVSAIISELPPGSEMAVRDVAEAYRTIPLHPSQWPAAAVRIDDESFCIDTCAAFGARPSGGIYGLVADAAAEIPRSQGIGPLVKWVDDKSLFRILRHYLASYNEVRTKQSAHARRQGGVHQSGGRLWYGGDTQPDGSVLEMAEDCSFQLRDFSASSPRSSHDALFSYSICDVDKISDKLGIPWERSKDVPFSTKAPYIGLVWDLTARSVALSAPKMEKYKRTITVWTASPTHTLEEIQKLYGQLLHACLVVPAGRARLTGLEAMLGPATESPFVPRHAHHTVADDLNWWAQTLATTQLCRQIPSTRNVIDCHAYSDASSGVGIAITIGSHWRAWRLILGWQTLDGKRDIGWAEAVGFQFLVDAITRAGGAGQCFKLYGDNKGVVEGWWNGRSRNAAVNSVFKQIHDQIESRNFVDSIFAAYVPSADNPADKPSRGIYPPDSLLLPPITMPQCLSGLLVDAGEPLSRTEIGLLRKGRYPLATARIFIDREQATQRKQFNSAHFAEELKFNPKHAYDET